MFESKRCTSIPVRVGPEQVTIITLRDFSTLWKQSHHNAALFFKKKEYTVITGP